MTYYSYSYKLHENKEDADQPTPYALSGSRLHLFIKEDGVSGGFPGVLPFRPPIDWLVSMSEIILKGTLN